MPLVEKKRTSSTYKYVFYGKICDDFVVHISLSKIKSFRWRYLWYILLERLYAYYHTMHIIILSCPVSNLRQICLLHDKAPSYTFKIKSNPVQLFPFQESYNHYYSQQALGSEISQFLRGLPNHCIMTHLTNGFKDRNCLSQTAGNTIDVI